MEESRKLRITLNIAGNSYPMTIDMKNEEKYRRAEKEINDLMARFKSLFAGDEKNHLAMAALQIALNKVEMEMSRSLGEEWDRLLEIDKQLGNYFSSLK